MSLVGDVGRRRGNVTCYCPYTRNHNSTFSCSRKIEIEKPGTGLETNTRSKNPSLLSSMHVPSRSRNIQGLPRWLSFLKLVGVPLDLQVTKADVDAALGVMNFAIYHKELTDMNEREAELEREREQDAQKKRMAEDSNVNEEDLSTDNRLVLHSHTFILFTVIVHCNQQLIILKDL